MGDLRLGGRWTLVQRLRNDAWYVAIRTAHAWVRGWRAERLWRAGRVLGSVAYWVLPRWRRAVNRGLTRAFAQAAPVEAREVFRGLGEDLGDAVAVWSAGGRAAEGLEWGPGSERLLRAVHARGRGVIFATAHLGRMERMAAVVAELGMPVTTLARESYDPRLTSFYDTLRGTRGVRTIYRGRPGADRAVVGALRRGDLVGFPMDLAGRGMQCVRVQMLGMQRDLPVGPARIALRTGASLVVGTPERVDGRVVLTVEEIGVEGEPDGHALTQVLANVLGRRICSLPEHWPWMASGGTG